MQFFKDKKLILCQIKNKNHTLFLHLYEAGHDESIDYFI